MQHEALSVRQIVSALEKLADVKENERIKIESGWITKDTGFLQCVTRMWHGHNREDASLWLGIITKEVELLHQQHIKLKSVKQEDLCDELRTIVREKLLAFNSVQALVEKGGKGVARLARTTYGSDAKTRGALLEFEARLLAVSAECASDV